MLQAEWPAGTIRVMGLKKGSSQIKIKDQVNGQEALIKVHVVDPFLVFKIGSPSGIIEGVDFETYSTIRKNIEEQITLKRDQILILHRNPNFQFFLFNNQEDLKNSVIQATGTYELAMPYGGPTRLSLKFEDQELQELFPLHITSDTIFSILLDFSKTTEPAEGTVQTTLHAPINLNTIKAELPQNTSPISISDFYLFKDLTSQFQSLYPSISKVQVFQEVQVYRYNSNVNIGEGILK